MPCRNGRFRAFCFRPLVWSGVECVAILGSIPSDREKGGSDAHSFCEAQVLLAEDGSGFCAVVVDIHPLDAGAWSYEDEVARYRPESAADGPCGREPDGFRGTNAAGNVESSRRDPCSSLCAVVGRVRRGHEDE